MQFVLKLSKLCNLRCTYCYEYDELGDGARMPLDRLAYFFERLAEHYLDAGLTAPLNFVLHGGEPLLLPADYLRSLVDLQQQHFGAIGIAYMNVMQTNLYRINPKTIQLLENLGIGIGVSLDVFGGQRVDAAGLDSQERVLGNLQALADSGAAQRLGVGLITVLHAGNADHAVESFQFCQSRGYDYRILPIFSVLDPPLRMRHLMLNQQQVVESLKAVTEAQFASSDRPITVLPLRDYLLAAVRYLTGRHLLDRELRAIQWALIINTNGDVFYQSEVYSPEFQLGNAFAQPVSEWFQSDGHRRAAASRAARSDVCDRCRYCSSCTRVPLVEALPSERQYDSQGRLQCSIARPMIDFMVEQISHSSPARQILTDIAGHAPSSLAQAAL